MDNTTHTPGQLDWLPSSVSGPPLIIEVSTQRVVAELNDDPNMDDYARLFAVAPELLECVVALIPWIQMFADEYKAEGIRVGLDRLKPDLYKDGLSEMENVVSMGTALIAKAEGQTNDT